MISIAYFHDPVKWRNPAYPQYPKPAVRDRIGATSMTLVEVTAQDVLGGRLERDNFSVLLVPGGFAPHWSDALGTEGERIIQRFVRSGGGYVGLCAGAYYGVWSGLLPAEIVDIEHWKRGSTDHCEIRWTRDGIDSLGTPPTSHVRYNNGPILRGTGTAAKSLADFVTELRGAKNKLPPAMAGNSAVLHGTYGKGRVVLVSPHIEASTDATTTKLFCNLFRLVARGATNAAPCHVFVYGSLRPDDDSGMPWTRGFSAGLTARRGSIGPARLYEDEYASVVLGGEGDDASAARVVGFVLGCADPKTFAARLRKADEIEGYDPKGGGLYERAVVDVSLVGGETVRAYVYHRPECKRTKRIWSGDWLLRRSVTEGKRPVEVPDAASSSQTSDSSSSDTEDEEEAPPADERSEGGTALEAAPPAALAPPPRATALGDNPHAPVRLVTITQPRPSFRPDSGRHSGNGTSSAASQKLRTARLAAPRVSAARAPPPSSDGYSSFESYVCSLGAPLLFTAPHGLKLKRGAGPTQSARNHARERYTSELVLKLAAKLAERRGAHAAAASSSSTPDGDAAPPMASFMVRPLSLR